VHTHTSKAGILGRFAAYLAKVPIIIYTTHGHIFRDAYYLGAFKVKIYTLLERIAAIVTDKIIVLSENEKQDHIKFKVAKPDRLEIIHSGLALDKFINTQIDILQKKKELNLPFNSLIVGTVGLLGPRKGQRYLIEAAPLVLETIKDALFLIVGDGEFKTELEDLTKTLRVEKSVVFTGWRQDIPEILGILDLFVFASIREGLGLALVEAMVMKRPVVATNVGGIPEVVKDNITGLLIAPCDHKALAGAIIKMLTDRERAKHMGELARDYVYYKFSQELMLEKINHLYEALIQKKVTLVKERI
jgi:glycosyltransferase involved in cell wall biosynthesis